jgi:hypothetical protein
VGPPPPLPLRQKSPVPVSKFTWKPTGREPEVAPPEKPEKSRPLTLDVQGGTSRERSSSQIAPRPKEEVLKIETLPGKPLPFAGEPDLKFPSLDGRRIYMVKGSELIIRGDRRSVAEIHMAMLRVVGLSKHAKIHTFVFE